MAFNPTNFKVPPITLYVASWGPDQWVTHDYEYQYDGGIGHDVQPLVFQYGEQKVRHDQNGKEIRYAYHIPPHGGKHGVEYLTKEDGTKAKAWNVKSMLKAIAAVLSKKYGVTEVPEFSVGQMDNNRNDAYAKYPCGLTIAVHIARPDAEDPNDADIGPIWYSLQNGKNWPECFDMTCKVKFVEICANILNSK